nr:MFS transporter [Micromonospora sp. DSM 115978]
RQRTLAEPLLDLRLFSRGPFTAALSGMMITTLTMGALMVFIAQYLQLVQGLSPLHAGLWMLPAVGASVVSFLFAPLLARRIPPGYLVGGGLAVSVCGLLAVTQADAGGSGGDLAVLVAGFALINFGAGPIVTLGTDLVVGSVPPEKAGSAAAMNETAGEFGFAIGIASL